jgi:hypothetical protein
MDAALDRYLDQQDAAYDELEFDAGWLAAQEGNAWTVNGGIGIFDGTAVEVATNARAEGVKQYWQWAGITR